MPRDGQPAESSGVNGTGSLRFKALGRARDARGQRAGLLRISQFGQKSADQAGFAPGEPDSSQRHLRTAVTALDRLEQKAFERAAILWSIRVNPAKFAIKSGAWLREAGRRGPCVPRRVAGLAAEGSERAGHAGSFGRPQFHVAKDHAIAAESAARAKGFRRIAGMNWSLQVGRTLAGDGAG